MTELCILCGDVMDYDMFAYIGICDICRDIDGAGKNRAELHLRHWMYPRIISGTADTLAVIDQLDTVIRGLT